MVDALALTTAVAALLLGLWALAAVAFLSGPPGKLHTAGLGLLEAALLVQAAVAVVLLLRGERPAELGAFVGYLVVSVLAVPAGFVWSAAEQSRWGTGVLGVSCLTAAVIVARLQQTWAPAGA